MKTKIAIIIIAILLVIIAVFYFMRENVFIPEAEGPSRYTTEEAEVEQVYLNYLKAGKNCDMDLAYSIITEQSKEIVHFTCSNMANETKCYRDREYEIRVKGDNAVVYLSPFSYNLENPFFLSKENGEWKLNLYKMWAGLVMMGSICDSGWSWRNLELREEFCSYEIEGSKCSDEL